MTSTLLFSCIHFCGETTHTFWVFLILYIFYYANNTFCSATLNCYFKMCAVCNLHILAQVSVRLKSGKTLTQYERPVISCLQSEFWTSVDVSPMRSFDFIWGQFCRKCSRYLSFIWVWRLLIKNYSCIWVAKSMHWKNNKTQCKC